MHVQCGIAAQFLRGIFDHQVRTLNAVIGCDVFARNGGGGTAPGEPGLIKVGFQFGHAGRGGTFVDDTCPFSYDLEQQGALPLVHSGGFESFGHNRFAILARAEYKVSQTVAQNRLLPLALVERLQQSEALIALRAERTYGFPLMV